ncbi:hypothetical protein [Rhizobium gallicum]|uniref:hypothetical protein n=1 Tax=Rhizobium gallicum TaxID=56730 RepID=UPI001939E87B|nr:hypothetical protein [Rhizobium gallicum]
MRSRLAALNTPFFETLDALFLWQIDPNECRHPIKDHIHELAVDTFHDPAVGLGRPRGPFVSKNPAASNADAAGLPVHVIKMNDRMVKSRRRRATRIRSKADDASSIAAFFIGCTAEIL